MLTFIYRSPNKQEMYLYINKRDDFSVVPEALLKVFGRPQFAFQLNLAKRNQLAREDINRVKDALNEQGYFLQMPPVVLSDKNTVRS